MHDKKHIPTVNDIFAIYPSLYFVWMSPRFSEKIAEGQMKALAASLRYQLRQIFPRMSPVARRMFTCSSSAPLALLCLFHPLHFDPLRHTHRYTHQHKEPVSGDHLHTLVVQLPLTSSSSPRSVWPPPVGRAHTTDHPQHNHTVQSRRRNVSNKRAESTTNWSENKSSDSTDVNECTTWVHETQIV